eukprot:INCI14261.1.p1 GENE.INCI14261.1~~INCI14261.1.p1  ORF type:complete len:329 (-),score=51.57 INCI14261.1:127-1113(-)
MTLVNLSVARVVSVHVGPLQVLIRVVGSSVNPCDVDLVKSFEAVLARGLHKTLGFDVSGVVVALGPETDGRLKVGDEVWTDLGEMGLSSTEKVVEMGAFAEFAIADEHQVGLKPANLTFAQAGVVPLVGLTNLESFYAAGAPWYNQTNVTVVVTSGQGGTGHIAVPMAKALGARTVISTASTANVEWVKSLGADIVVDFTKESVWSVLPDDSVDVVYDNIGLPGNADAAMKSLRTGGHLVMIQGDLSEHPKPGVSQTRLLCKADDYHLLDTIADMVNVGNISDVRLQQSFPLASIGEAYNEQASGSVVGKVAIAIGVAPNSSASAQGY